MQQQGVREKVREAVAAVLCLSPGDIPCNKRLADLGMDSILGVELIRNINRVFGLNLKKEVVYEYPAVDDLAELLVAQMPQNEAVQVAPAEKSASAVSVPDRQRKLRLRRADTAGAPDEDLGAQGSLRHLEQRFGWLPPDLLQTHPSVEALADYFVKNHRRRLEEIVSLRPLERRPVAEDIAIIGLDGRYPMAPNLSVLWENLKSGKNCISEVPKERWDGADYSDLDPAMAGNTYGKWGGFIEDPDKFDALFFNISPREAAQMDPQARLLLEVVWNVLEGAGYTRSELERIQSDGRKVGLFVGCMYYQYPWLAKDERTGAILSNTSYWRMVNRCSYFFNLRGPSVAVDTACSSSLSAIHMASESIRRGECEMAIAGGVNLNLHPSKYIALKEAGLLGSENRSRSLGQGDGYLPGEGVGAVLLKSLASAIRDGDSIRAVIKGSSMNHGGASTGFTVPNPDAQRDLVLEVLEKSGVHPRTISYVEASATGAPIGDREEVAGLTSAFRLFTTERQYCAIGSVKSNIGHLEAAAGISQLTKVVLQLQKQTLVPTINAEPANPDLDLEESPFYLQKTCQPWLATGAAADDGGDAVFPRRAAINSFGAGGANAHLVVEEYLAPAVDVGPKLDSGAHLVVLSARDRDTLEEYARRLVAFLLESRSEGCGRLRLEDLAYTLQVGREPMSERLAVLVSNLDDLELELKRALDGRGTPGVVFRGTAAENPVIAALRLNGPVGAELLGVITKSGELARLAQFWVGGVAMDWRLLYGTHRPRRIWLPTYPFTRKRYWLDQTLPPSIIEASPDSGGAVEAVRSGLSESTLRPRIAEQLKSLLAQVLGLDHSDVDEDKHFLELGLDSVLSVELLKNVNRTLNVNLKATVLYDYSTVSQLSRHLSANASAPPDVKFETTPDASRHARAATSIATAQPKMCQGLSIEGVGEIASVAFREVVIAPPRAREIQIRTKASALNFADIMCVQGLYPTMPDYPFVAGFQVAGVVEQVGAEVTHFRVGDAVVALTGYPLGGHAEYVNTSEELAILKPEQITFEDVCGFPDVFITAYHCLHEIGKIKAGDHVLIQSAAGGVGLMAVQLAKLSKAVIYGTSSSSAKLEYLKSCGVDFVINHREEDFQERVMRITSGRGVDIVLDTLCGDTIQKGINCLAPGGRYLEIAVAGLRKCAKVDLAHMTGNQSFHGVDLRKLFVDYHEVNRYLKIMERMIRCSELSSIVFKTFPAQEVRNALRYIADRKSIGKVALVFSGNPGGLDCTADAGLSCTARSSGSVDDIAVIGMSGRFPGAQSIDEFWDNLVNGVCSVTEVPHDRWDISQYYDPDPDLANRTYCRWGGFLRDADRFDPSFFNITPMEAELMDPQQRLFLEEAYKAVEDAGYSTKTLAEERCGVFAGAGSGDYSVSTLSLANNPDAYSLMGSTNSMLTGRVAYSMDLKGPNLAVDTACSSSLLALHLACESIRNGESDVAIAGGVHVMATPGIHIMASKGRMLGTDKTCRTFDNRANGFIPGEAVGVVVIKPLRRALQDGDHIYGVIKGSGTNQDGRTNGITAPSGRAQSALACGVYDRFGLHPGDFGYVEAHGTGTKLGDPIEVEALTKAYRKYTNKRQFCAIGSVKTNIGHSMAAAGIAGTIKALLCLHHEKLVPSLSCETENEHIDFAASPFFVSQTARAWERRGDKPRQAAVSSFGFSGTNVHMVLEEAPLLARPAEGRAEHGLYIVALSARGTEALLARLRDFGVWLRHRSHRHSLADISYTLLTGRVHGPARFAVVVADRNELERALEEVLGSTADGKSRCVGYSTRSSQATVDSSPQAALEAILDALEGSLTSEKHRASMVKLAEFYLKGYEPDWKRLFTGVRHYRVALPTYPFARERYWRQAPNPDTASLPAHEQDERAIMDVLEQLKDGRLELREADQMIESLIA